MIGEKDVVIRKATIGDLERVYRWRNLKEIVALSHLQKTVTWEEHCAWFQGSLASPQHSIHIIAYKNREVGLCRFERTARVCELSIYLIPGYTEQGIGSIALNKILLFESEHCRLFRALVRRDNTHSCLFFEKNGFVRKDISSNVVTYEYKAGYIGQE